MQKVYEYVLNNPEDVAQLLYENRGLAFQTVSNAQRFVSKARGVEPVRYLKRGEIHLPNHNFTGPGTRIDLKEVRNFPPYNNIDACSRTHDLQYQEAFKMPIGKERAKKIRDADVEAVSCYSQHPNEAGYNLAKAGINAKMGLEEVSPAAFNQIMGEDYSGVVQEGGADPVTLGLIAAGLPVAATIYGEYRLGRMMYDKYRGQV